MWKKAQWISCVVFLAFISNAWAAHGPPTVLLVDKKTNQLKVANYTGGAYEILKSFHTTVGQVVGDKEEEGDLKTPEGIYFFTAKVLPPQIKPKFGVMAFHMDYPNSWDKIAGRTGNNIMLHATNEPERLLKNFDSEGCVVVKNEELEEIQKYIRLQQTPIIIFSELKEEYLNPTKDGRLKAFFESWVKAWETKDLDHYVDSYHSKFTAQGMDRPKWKIYKGNLNKQYETISVGATDVRYFVHPKYSVIAFTQNYHSKLKNGRDGHVSRGTKTLYIGEEGGSPKIIDENFSRGTW